MERFIYKATSTANYAMFYSNRKKAVESLLCHLRVLCNCDTKGITVNNNKYYVDLTARDEAGNLQFCQVEKVNLH